MGPTASEITQRFTREQEPPPKRSKPSEEEEAMGPEDPPAAPAPVIPEPEGSQAPSLSMAHVEVPDASGSDSRKRTQEGDDDADRFADQSVQVPEGRPEDQPQKLMQEDASSQPMYWHADESTFDDVELCTYCEGGLRITKVPMIT